MNWAALTCTLKNTHTLRAFDPRPLLHSLGGIVRASPLARPHAQRVHRGLRRLLRRRLLDARCLSVRRRLGAFAFVRARLLRWAALLHEIGLAISHKGYHKHGEYILRNADLEGFSRSDQAVLATLVRLHRGRFRSDLIDALPEDWRGLTYRLALVLRLAVILHRGRDPQIAPPAWLEVEQGEISLYCDADWLEERPLTQADLAREAELLARADIKLKTLPEA